MLKKLLLVIASLGLTVPNVASADPRVQFRVDTPEISVRVGNAHSRWERERIYRDHWNRQRYYNRIPRCGYREIAVRHPHRYNRYICVDRRVYRDYRREF